MISCYMGCQFFFGFEGLTATFVFFFGHGIHTKEHDVCHTNKPFEHAARGRDHGDSILWRFEDPSPKKKTTSLRKKHGRHLARFNTPTRNLSFRLNSISMTSAEIPTMNIP